MASTLTPSGVQRSLDDGASWQAPGAPVDGEVLDLGDVTVRPLGPVHVLVPPGAQGDAR